MADEVAVNANGGDATSNPDKLIKVTCHGGKRVFDVKLKILKMFQFVKTMLETLGDEDDGTPLPLTNVREEIFEKILEWCEWHMDDPEESEDESDDEERDRRIDDIPQWDVKFIGNLSRSDTFEMMQACNYLDIQYLLELLSKTVAGWMKGKSVEAIREEFGIENDYTPEEDERLKKENAWAEEAVLKNAQGAN